jgi:hypothetical protein
MSETGVLCLAFGIVLLLNIISIILLHTTDYGKDYYARVKKNSIGYQIFFNVWMLLCGFCFWIAVGVSKVIEILRK